MSFRYGTAYLDVVPQIARNAFGGVDASISRALEGPAAKAGKEAGEKAAKSFNSGFGDKVKSLAGPAAVAGGAAIGAGLVGGVMGAIGREASTDKLAAQLGIVDPSFAADLGKIAGSLYENNFGDSFAGVNDALKSVLSQNLIPDDFEGDFNAAIEGITGKALNLASVFEVDVAGSTQAAGQLIKTGLAKNADEAFDIITKGFQQGVDKRGDFLDTLNEYGTQFRKLGIDGTEATGLLSQGLSAGARDADLVADALKEFSIRAVDGSKLTAEGFQAVGLNADAMTAAIAQGGPTAKKALGQTLDGLRGIEDPAKRAQAATALFGTQAEDLGAALFSLNTDKAALQLGAVAGAADKMGAQIGDNASAKIETFKRKVTDAFVTTLGGKVIPIAESVSKWIGDNTEVVVALGVGITAALVPAFIAWAAAAIPAAAATVAAAAPVIALGVVVGGLALLIIKNWDTIKAVTLAVWGAVKDAFATAAGFLQRVVGGVVGFIGDHWKLILGILTGPIGLAVLFITDHFNQIVGFVTGLPARIGKAASGMWDGIKNAFRSAVNFIIRGWNRIEFKIPGFKVGPVHFGGFKLGLPDIPTLHSGGVYHAPPGQTEGFAFLRDGETVIPTGGRGSMPSDLENAFAGGGGFHVGDIQVDARGARDPWRVGKTLNQTLRELAYANGWS